MPDDFTTIHPTTLVPYRLAEFKDKDIVFVVEGEADAEEVWALGVPGYIRLWERKQPDKVTKESL